MMHFVCPTSPRSPFFHVQSEDMPRETLKCCEWAVALVSQKVYNFSQLFLGVGFPFGRTFPCLSAGAMTGYNIQRQEGLYLGSILIPKRLLCILLIVF